MKTGVLSLLLTGLLVSAAHAQVTVKVDVSQKIKYLNGRENGINLDYLMDGSYLSPSVPLSTSIKNMGIKLLRYPGGEKADNYLWSAAPWAAASPRMALPDTAKAWPTKDSRFVDKQSPEKLCKPDVLDFDEFMVVSKATGAEPLIVVAYDAIYNSIVAAKPTKAQLITNAVEWVRYANVTKKFGIKYWMIGNESWNHPDYNGQTTPAQYAADLADFAKAMKAVDPSIKIIANGQASWWPALLQSPAVSYIDILAFSMYPVDSYTKGYESYRASTKSLTTEVDAAVRAINTYAPTADKARLKLLVSEYNSIDWSGGWTMDNNLGHALCNFQMFGDMTVNPKVESACLWNTRWTENNIDNQHIYDALDKNGNPNATGLAQQVWGQNLLQAMVAASSSDVLVKTYATYDTLTKSLNIFLLNKDTAAKKVTLSLASYAGSYKGSLQVFTGASVNDKFPGVTQVGSGLPPAALNTLSLAPASVTVVKLTAFEAPVTLVSFTGNRVAGGVQLQWRSQNDFSLRYYEVEKQAGTSGFERIGTVDIPDRSKTEASYLFVDTASYLRDATLKYRLKMTGQYGEVRYSDVVEMPSAGTGNLSITVTPNPVYQQVQVQVFSTLPERATVSILDALGNAWGSEKVQLQTGTTTITFPNGAALPRGTYTLKLETPTRRKAVRFIKL